MSDKLVNDFLFVLEIYQQMKPELNQALNDSICSENAYQTPNILEFDLFQKVSLPLLEYIPYDMNLDLFHIHLIEYFNGGLQRGHDHKKTEDFSFILYLNDSDDGHSCFLKKNTIKIKPTKGKIIFFQSDIWHWGEHTSGNKKVAVGALKKINNG